jgi:hypothetical protein
VLAADASVEAAQVLAVEARFVELQEQFASRAAVRRVPARAMAALVAEAPAEEEPRVAVALAY